MMNVNKSKMTDIHSEVENRKDVTIEAMIVEKFQPFPAIPKKSQDPAMK